MAFALGLVVAWWQKWNTTDLVWSLWLSSLVVGYLLIVWMVTRPLRETLWGVASARGDVEAGLASKAVAVGLVGAGTVFGLAFFTVHFGGFHFVHSVFLGSFFPIAVDGHAAAKGWPNWAVYAEVVRRYWWYLPAALIAERAAFRPKPVTPDTAVTFDAITRRRRLGDPMMEPYKNVIRMHLLIFFFAFAHFAKLENFYVYAVVYAAYFLPWRLLARPKAVA